MLFRSLHGGSIEARSGGAGQGSEFIVRLPKTVETLVVPHEDRQTGENEVLPSRRVLVVDDNVDAAETTGMLLRMAGHAVTLAHDGSAAIAAAREFRPEVVLLDIGMPKLNGYDTARRAGNVGQRRRRVFCQQLSGGLRQ